MKQIWVTLLLVLATSSASADLYFGAGFGRTSYEFELDSSTAMKYYLGNRLSDNFAIELGFVDSGRAIDDEDIYEQSTETVTFALKILTEFADKSEVYLQFGAHSWEIEDTDMMGTEKSDDRDLFWGVGIHYEVDSEIYLGVEHTSYEAVEEDYAAVNALVVEFVF